MKNGSWNDRYRLSRIYIYVSGYLLVFFFISHCVPFDPVLDDFFLFESNLWQTFYRDKISI